MRLHFLAPKNSMAIWIAWGMTMTAIASPGFADQTSWHFHLLVNTGVPVTDPGPAWGASPHYLTKIDNPTVPNVVWNESNVFYTHPYGRSYYDQWNIQTNQRIAVHNPTLEDYVSFWVIFMTLYDANTGNQILGSHGILKTNPSPSWLVWNPTSNRFQISVPSLETRIIHEDDIVLPGKHMQFLVELHSPTTGGGNGAFIATSHMTMENRWRINKADDNSSSFHAWPYRPYTGYLLPSSTELEAVITPVLVLPYWLDNRDDPFSQSTAFLHIGNVDEVDLDITVSVFELDGTLIKTHTLDDVVPRSRVTFIPSQFLDGGDPKEGYIEASAVRSSAPGVAGKIHGGVHHHNFSLVHFNFTTGLGYQVGKKGEALTVVDGS